LAKALIRCFPETPKVQSPCRMGRGKSPMAANSLSMCKGFSSPFSRYSAAWSGLVCSSMTASGSRSEKSRPRLTLPRVGRCLGRWELDAKLESDSVDLERYISVKRGFTPSGLRWALLFGSPNKVHGEETLCSTQTKQMLRFICSLAHLAGLEFHGARSDILLSVLLSPKQTAMHCILQVNFCNPQLTCLRSCLCSSNVALSPSDSPLWVSKRNFLLLDHPTFPGSTVEGPENSKSVQQISAISCPHLGCCAAQGLLPSSAWACKINCFRTLQCSVHCSRSFV